MYNNELYHFGVKGMKWGHRKDTYTMNETRTRYKRGEARAQLNYAKNIASAKNKRKEALSTAETRPDRNIAKLEYRIDRNKAKRTYKNDMPNVDKNYFKDLKKTTYSSVLLETAGISAAGVLATAAGKALEARGKEYAGGFLKSFGAGTTVGGLVSGTITAGMIYAARLK